MGCISACCCLANHVAPMRKCLGVVNVKKERNGPRLLTLNRRDLGKTNRHPLGNYKCEPF